MNEEQLAFKIITRSGYTYQIYTDGRIEGFEADSIVINRYPALLQRAVYSAANGIPSLNKRLALAVKICEMFDEAGIENTFEQSDIWDLVNLGLKGALNPLISWPVRPSESDQIDQDKASGQA